MSIEVCSKLIDLILFYVFSETEQSKTTQLAGQRQEVASEVRTSSEVRAGSEVRTVSEVRAGSEIRTVSEVRAGSEIRTSAEYRTEAEISSESNQGIQTVRRVVEAAPSPSPSRKSSEGHRTEVHIDSKRDGVAPEPFESAVHGREIHVATQKQTQKEVQGQLEITRKITATETTEVEHKARTQERVVQGQVVNINK